MKIGRVLVAAGIGAATVGILRRRRKLAPVRQELRSPGLYVPLSLRDQRSLRIARRLPIPATPLADDVDVDERAIESSHGQKIRVLLYERSGRTRRSGALLWIHGGGMVIGTPEQSHATCSRFADELDLLVVSVDYRLAPEHPFPTPLEDCVAALRWLAEQAAELGVDLERIAVGGDSAGGGLAATVAQKAHDDGGPSLSFQLLVYPMLDDRTVLRADHAGRGALVWTPASNRFGWTAFLGHPPTIDPERPYAAAARRADLSGLPPAWIGVGDLDLFYEEDVDYAERLQTAGVPCELVIDPGVYHGADSMLPNRPYSKAFRSRMIEAVRRGLGQVSSS